MRIAFEGDVIPEVHYLYPLKQPNQACQQVLECIRPSVRSITALGWGIDQVAADATLLTEADLAVLRGEKWQPASRGAHRLRVHRTGTLEALLSRHQRFLNRLANGNFT